MTAQTLAQRQTWPEGKLWDQATQERNWLVCRLEARKGSVPGKLDKIPLDPTGRFPVGFDRAAQLTFDHASKLVQDYNLATKAQPNQAGSYVVGYLPRPGSALVGVDLDDALENGTVRPAFKDVVDAADSYMEVSPSGNGLRGLIARADTDEQTNGAERGGVGLFAQGKKFFTVTGCRFGSRSEITAGDQLRGAVLSRLNGSNAPAPLSAVTGARQTPLAAPWRGVPPERREAALRDALTKVEVGNDDEWLKISAAIHSAGPELGPQVAEELWHEWCHRIGGDMSQNQKRWNSLQASKQGGASVATVFSAAESNGWRSAKHVFGAMTPQQIQAAAASGLGGKNYSVILGARPIGLGVLANRQPQPRALIDGIVPLTPFTIVGAGGSHKTTIALKLAFHVILGREVWGQKINRPGPVVFFSMEDDLRVFNHRIHRIARAMKLSQAEMDLIKDKLFVIDLTGQLSLARLVEADRSGNFQRTQTVDVIIQRFLPEMPSLILFDPATYFGPGERHVNDGKAVLMSAMTAISRGVGGAAVGVIHHTGKEAARSKTMDQYSGRGGSALADNARGVITIRGVKEHSLDLPDEATGAHVDKGLVAQVNSQKLSHHARDRDDLFVIRGLDDAFDLRFVRGKPKPATRVDKLAQQAQQKLNDMCEAEDAILRHVEAEVAAGGYPSKTSIRNGKDMLVTTGGFNVTKALAGQAVDRLVATGRLQETPLPKGLAKGARKTYLTVPPVAEDTATGDPSRKTSTSRPEGNAHRDRDDFEPAA